MRKTRFTQMVVLVCIGSLAGCSSGEGGTVGNTELNVMVPIGSGQSGPGTSPTDIQSVEYTINCLGTPSSFLDEPTELPNGGAVQINGNLEVVDGRTDPQGPIPPEFGTARPGDGAEIWQGFMDLPVGDCTIQLRARDNDGEVICSATESFAIEADVKSKVNLVLVCDTSFQAPVGMLDVDATFSFVVGNFCPDLFVINCNPQDESVAVIDTFVGPQAPAGCQVRFRDVDSTCGQSCDPQECDVTPEGLDCQPGPDNGVTTTVTCEAGIPPEQQIPGIPPCAMDCEADGQPDANCVYNGDTLGEVGQQPPAALNPGEGGFVVGFALCSQQILDAGGIPGLCDDPILIGEPIYSGVTCTAETTDGDEDCDKSKSVTLTGPGANFCDTEAGDACSDTSAEPHPQCVVGSCDRDNQQCILTPVPGGGGANCDTAPGGGLGQCDGNGVCEDFGCSVDADCDNPLTPCLVAPAGACDVASGLCAPEVPGNDGDACDSGVGSGDGICSGGTCASNDACSVDGDCPDPDGECVLPLCDTTLTPYACGSQNAAVGTPCTEVPNGACTATGTCEAPPVIEAGSGQTIWRANTTPPGGVPGATGGCTVFVTALNTEIFLQVDITLDVVSDGNNNIGTSWQIIAANFLLPTLGNAAELGGLAIEAAVDNAAIGGGAPGAIGSGLTEAATGQLIGAFFNADGQLELNSPSEITEGTGAATPLDGAVSVNWDGRFTLDLTLGGAPLVTVDESVCVFDEVGDPIVFQVN